MPLIQTGFLKYSCDYRFASCAICMPAVSKDMRFLSVRQSAGHFNRPIETFL